MKVTDTFLRNFIIANYGSMAAIDNDDTSGHYEAAYNVFAYSMMGLKVLVPQNLHKPARLPTPPPH